jgi:hypothetical protein
VSGLKKFKKALITSALLAVSMVGVSSVALADASMDFEITSVGYENGVLKATGLFTNTGDKHIQVVNHVDVKITLHNDAGDSAEVADHDFTNLELDAEPGEAVEYTLEFPDVPEYTDATQWSAEEGEWEFTYTDEAAEEEVTEEEVAAEEEAVDEEVAAEEAAIEEVVEAVEEAVDAIVEAVEAGEISVEEAEAALDELAEAIDEVVAQ